MSHTVSLIILYTVIIAALILYIRYRYKQLGKEEKERETIPTLPSSTDMSQRHYSFYPYIKMKKKLKPDAEADALKQMLISLYAACGDFTLEINRTMMPKTRMGIYNPNFRHITIYSRWGCVTEVAIHEYAHHLEAETRISSKPKKHGKAFKDIQKMLNDRYYEKTGIRLQIV